MTTAFIIIYDDTRFVPEQGHGYPSYTAKVKSLVECADEAAVIKWISDNERFGYKKTFKVYSAKEMKVDTQIKISLT